MSCRITVTLFPARDRTNAFAVAKNLTTHVNRHKKDIIAQNQMAMPSIREAGRAPQDILREWDRDWAFSLLAQKFLFYPKYQLLTLMGGPLPGLDQSTRTRSVTLTFQDSTDNDFFIPENWRHVPFLADLYADWLSMNEYDLKENLRKQGIPYEENSLDSLMKARTAAIEKTLFRKLGLIHWLSDERIPNTIPFAMHPIISQKDLAQLYLDVKQIRDTLPADPFS